MEVRNKTIVVTGGGNGVGRELVLQLLAKGAKVAALDMNQKGLEETAELSGNSPSLSLHTINITDQAAIETALHEFKAYHGVIDGLINNAGIIQPFVGAEELDQAVIDQVLKVNFFGTLAMTRALLPELRKRPESCLVNVSSMGGYFPFPGQSIYGASKAAVRLLTEALYAELLDTSVKVSVIIPGGISTNIMKNSNLEGAANPMDGSGSQLLLTPQKAAKQIIRVMEQGKFRAFLGKDAKLLSFLYKFAPKMAIRLVKRTMTVSLPKPAVEQ